MGDGQMQYQHYLEDVVRDLIDLALGLLERWRCVVTVGLIFAILLPCAKYFTSVRSFNDTVTGVETALEGNIELGDDLEKPVIKALSFYSQYNAKEKYFTSSNITDIEGTKEERFTLLYYIHSEKGGTDAVSIAKIYGAMATDQDLQSGMAEVMGMNSDNEYVKELYYYTIQDNDSSGLGREGASFTFTVILPGKIDVEKLEKTVTDYLKAKQTTFSKQVGKYTVDLVTSFYSTVDNQTRIDSQIDYYKKLEAAESSFVKAYKTCSPQEKLLVNAIISRDMVDSGVRKIRRGDVQGLIEELKTREPVVQLDEGMDNRITDLLSGGELSAPSFPVVFIPIGFLGGMILFAAFYILLSITDRYVRNAADMKRMTSLRSFGEIYEYPYGKGIQRFAHDRNVYTFRHRDSGIPDREICRIMERLAAKAEHLHIPEVSFVVLGILAGRKEMILKQQISHLEEKKGIKVRYVAAGKGVNSIEEEQFNHMPPVFIIFLSGITTSVMVQQLMTRLEEYDVSMIGTELLESK